MSLLATPFHARAVEHNRRNAWVNRGGFTLAADYGSAAEEAVAARFGAVLADRSWHWRVALSGDQAAAFASRLLTRDAAALGLGAAMDVLWLNDGGAVRGSGTVTRTANGCFQLDSACEDSAWITSAARLYGVTVDDLTIGEGVLALIGRAAEKILEAAGVEPELAPASCRRCDWRGLDITLARRGLGFEIVCKADDALIVWDRLAAAGRGFALLPAGLAAVDVLELEAGILSPGRDFAPASEGFAAAPLPQALGLCGLVDRAHLFNGRPGVLAGGGDTTLGGVLFNDSAAPSQTVLMQGGQPAGMVLAVTWSAVLRQAVGLAVFPAALPDSPLTAAGRSCRAVPLPILP